MYDVFVFLVLWTLPAIIGFFVIYWAVRLAIRHERDRKQ
jgi:hypothetical protein